MAESLEAQLQATLNVIPAYTWYAAQSGGLTFATERAADYGGLPSDHPRYRTDTSAAWDSRGLSSSLHLSAYLRRQG